MKFLALWTIVGLGSFLFSETNPEPHLFILSGQSNMARLKPKDSFTPAVEKAFGESSVIVVHSAQGGQPIRRWYKNWKVEEGQNPKQIGDLYDKMMQEVNEAVAGKKISMVTFIWMQGERDAREELGSKYSESFLGLLEQIKKDMSIKNLNYVIGRLSDFDLKNEKYPHWTMVRDIQVKLAEASPYSSWVDTDDLNNLKKGSKEWNDLHYSKEGYVTLGQRFADKAIQLIKSR